MKEETMDVMMGMQRDAWRERQPIIPMPEPKVVKEYNPSEIYDDPAEYSTVRGIFRYTNVEMIPW